MRMSDLLGVRGRRRRRPAPRPGPRRPPRAGRPARAAPWPRLRVDAVIVGGSALAGRLGYLRGGVRGPALLAAVMRRLERRALTVDARRHRGVGPRRAPRLVLAAGRADGRRSRPLIDEALGVGLTISPATCYGGPVPNTLIFVDFPVPDPAQAARVLHRGLRWTSTAPGRRLLPHRPRWAVPAR